MLVMSLHKQNTFGADSEVGTASIATWTAVTASSLPLNKDDPPPNNKPRLPGFNIRVPF